MNSIQNIHALTASYQILKNQPEMEQQALQALPLELQERVIKIVGSALSITLQGALAQVAMESVQELPVESLSRIFSVFTNMCGEGYDPHWAQVHIGDIDKVDSFFEAMKSVLPEFKQFNQYLDLAINPSRFSVIESLVTGCAGTTISNYLGAEGVLNLSACSKKLHTIMPDVYYESKAASFSSWKQSISLDLANDPKIVLLKPEEGLSVAAIKKHVDAQIDAIYNIVLEKGTVDDLLGFLSHGLDCQANSNKKEELAKQFIENKDVSRLRALEPFLPEHFLDSTILRMIALNRWDHIEVITKSIRGLSLSSANYIIRTAILNDRVEYVRDLFKEFKDTMPSELNQAKEFLHEKLIESSSIMYLIQSGDFTEAKRRLESGHILLSMHLESTIRDIVRYNNHDVLELIIASSNREKEYRGYAVYTLAEHERLDMMQSLLPQGKKILEKDFDIALISAADRNNLEMVKFLNDRSPKLSIQTRSTLVEIAARHGNHQMIDFLLEGGKQITDYSKENAIGYAICHKKVELFKILSVHGIEIPNQQILRLLRTAVLANDEDCVRYLLDCKMQIPSDEINNLVIEAADNYNFPIVQLLLANIEKISQATLELVMKEFVYVNNIEAVRFILSSLEINKEHIDPGLFIAYENDSLEMIQLLLKYCSSEAVAEYYRSLQ